MSCSLQDPQRLVNSTQQKSVRCREGEKEGGRDDVAFPASTVVSGKGEKGLGNGSRFGQPTGLATEFITSL